MEIISPALSWTSIPTGEGQARPVLSAHLMKGA